MWVWTQRAGTEATFRASHETPKDTVTTVPINDTNGSHWRKPHRATPDLNSQVAKVALIGRDTETGCNDSLARLSRT